MTTATAITPPDQEARRRSPTIGLDSYAEPQAPRAKEPPGGERLAPTQSGPGLPASSTQSAQTRRAITPPGVRGLDKWEGKILSTDDDFFTAELHPIDREGIPITADFDLMLLGSDADDAVPGDVFYLLVRTVEGPGVRPTRTSSLRLRRLGRITQEEVQAVYAKADALMERLEQLFD